MEKAINDGIPSSVAKPAARPAAAGEPAPRTRMVWLPKAVADLLELCLEITPWRHPRGVGAKWAEVAERMIQEGHAQATTRNCQEKLADLERSYRAQQAAEKGRGSSGDPQEKSAEQRACDKALADIQAVRCACTCADLMFIFFFFFSRTRRQPQARRPRKTSSEQSSRKRRRPLRRRHRGE